MWAAGRLENLSKGLSTLSLDFKATLSLTGSADFWVPGPLVEIPIEEIHRIWRCRVACTLVSTMPKLDLEKISSKIKKYKET